jgi:prophage tail gpP-like protein
MPSELELLAAGRPHAGWKTIQVNRSIEAASPSFSLDITETHPTSPLVREILAGQEAVVSIDGEAVITGYVDRRSGRYDGRSYSVSVAGRGRTGQLVDCSAVDRVGGEWKGRTLLQIARDLAAPFEVEVSADVAVGAAFSSFKIDGGETAWDAIERAARQVGLLAVPDTEGGLVLTRAATARAGDTLELGANILRASWSDSLADRYSDYTVRGQSAGADGWNPRQSAVAKGTASDPDVELHRPLVIIAEDSGDAGTFGQRARWEAAVRAGRSFAYSCSVRGWRQASGDLWAPNLVVAVDDVRAGVRRDMLIVSTSYRMDESGEIASLDLAVPEAFEPEPLKPQRQTGGRIWN